MPLKHGPIEALLPYPHCMADRWFSMPLKHGPIEARAGGERVISLARFPCP